MLKKRKARGKPALDTVSILLALSMNNFLISSMLLPAAGGFLPAFAVAPGVLGAALLAPPFGPLLLLGVEVTATAEGVM
ncbi:hypothetical protein EYF80_026988 [Liparis tanakae]|uniref:Uncharacterized protein n=1 Tax=Liparis tanakae TaxID=230148 RepID=A0A4Z2HD95_9TELE|nr:hypothetical protein EYF80_026988 [Liparis tanakae]